MPSKSENYRGRVIELREEPRPRSESLAESLSQPKPELLIDGKEVAYGQLPGGKYYLKDYAYDWKDDLVDLAESYIDDQLKPSRAGK
ncbi:twin-arginine translocation pathway signal protein [Methylocystis hirsuta]|uniref:Twin-arginine translocation pathway signal protein n=1 Tax=Methylocystis hirsuta TaxID=369798 RepID=A0A3M9XPG3_9HYPH|nr:twin-arginine translocation pathway signal protein [Methylocystis hirsuta]RNJ50133.1 twin-arginine translocation pathway signal protein [Methylocystis hirsuta]